jgi:hypothetical protein
MKLQFYPMREWNWLLVLGALPLAAVPWTPWAILSKVDGLIGSALFIVLGMFVMPVARRVIRDFRDGGWR